MGCIYHPDVSQDGHINKFTHPVAMGLDDFFLLSAVSVLMVPETTVLMTSACRILIVPPPPPEADPLEDLDLITKG